MEKAKSTGYWLDNSFNLYPHLRAMARPLPLVPHMLGARKPQRLALRCPAAQRNPVPGKATAPSNPAPDGPM